MHHKKQVTLHSGTSRELILLAVPLIISFISHSLMSVVDTLVMGHVGTAQQAGVGLGGVMIWTLQSIFMGFISAVTTFVAQYEGGGRQFELRKWMHIAFLLMIPVCLLITSLAGFIDPLLYLLKTHQDIVPHAATYMRIMLIGSPFFLFSFVFMSFCRGIGDTMRPMINTLVSNAVNLVLNIILVFGFFGFPAMGVAGTAVATVIAVGVSTAMYSYDYFSNRNHWKYQTRRKLGVTFSEITQFVKIGTPIGLAWFMENLAFNIMTVYVGTYDSQSLAAHTVVFRIISFSFMPTIALSIAASTLVGQYLGARQKAVAIKSSQKSISFAVSFMGVVGLVFFIFSRQAIALFNTDPYVIELGAKALCIAAAFQIFDALSITIDGIFRGAGFTFFPMMVRLVVMWLIFVPLLFVFGHITGSGILGSWIALLVAMVLQGGIMLFAYLKLNWSGSALLKSE